MCAGKAVGPDTCSRMAGNPAIGCIRIKLLLTNLSQIPLSEDILLGVYRNAI
jgi:hypothetical protein